MSYGRYGLSTGSYPSYLNSYNATKSPTSKKTILPSVTSRYTENTNRKFSSFSSHPDLKPNSTSSYLLNSEDKERKNRHSSKNKDDQPRFKSTAYREIESTFERLNLGSTRSSQEVARKQYEPGNYAAEPYKKSSRERRREARNLEPLVEKYKNEDPIRPRSRESIFDKTKSRDEARSRDKSLNRDSLKTRDEFQKSKRDEVFKSKYQEEKRSSKHLEDLDILKDYRESRSRKNTINRDRDGSLPRNRKYSHNSSSSNNNSPRITSFTRSDEKIKQKQYENGGLVGLNNIGNTCFMNSILQCLSNTQKLKDFCLKADYEINPKSKMSGRLINSFSDLMKELWTSESSVTPRNLKHQVQKFSTQFSGYNQHDSQEFLRFLLEGLHEDINQVRRKNSKPLQDLDHLNGCDKAIETWRWYKTKEDSRIFDLFVGLLESALKCSECGYTSLTYDPFWDLSLPLAKSSYGDTSLEDCLQIFTKKEILDGDEQPKCEKCKCRRRMTKKLSIHKFPRYLVLHLKRFSDSQMFRKKLSTHVNFPTRNLDLSDFASTCSNENVTPTYELYAVSNHVGSTHSGHYTANCQNYQNKQWYNYNDSSCRQISESSVCTKEAYVLFYQLKSSRPRM